MGLSENPTSHDNNQGDRGGEQTPLRWSQRYCLLKGCERPYQPRHVRQRYCSAACEVAARQWSEWKAQRKYRCSEAGKKKRNEQSRHYRERVKERKRAGLDAVPTDARVITESFFRCLLRPAWLL